MTNSPILSIGVINWDCSVPSETTYFGRYATQSLGPHRFRDRTPYYASETGPDSIMYQERSVDDYEIEMQHAIAAKINYFAYCWYDRTPHKNHVVTSEAAVCDDTVCELASARLKHMQSSLRYQLNLCAILITCHPYSEDELKSLAETMKENYYEKVDGRPLVYLFASPWKDTLKRLRQFCRYAHTPDPFAVLMCNNISEEDKPLVQALSAYAGCTSEATDWEDLFEKELAQNEQRASYGKPIIPHFTMGWNPIPRILHPVPWTHYPDGTYTPPATSQQLFHAAVRFRQWVTDHQDSCRTGHVLTFAWNEFEEGAWICPTLGILPAQPDTHYRDAFAQMVDIWKG